MSPFRVVLARHVAARIACLALFLAGSNVCLLAGWGGRTTMACLTLPATAAPPRCHHCPAPTSRTGHETAKSCCPDPVVTPASVALDRIDAPAQVVPVAADEIASLAPAITWHDHRVLPDGRPPTRFARAPLPARAPPLA